MNIQQENVAKKCLDGAYENTMCFPETIKTLMEAGFEGYIVDYRSKATNYYLPDGSYIRLDHPHLEGSIAEHFDGEGIAELIKWAQSNAPDFHYKAFCTRVQACGCVGYIVSFLGKKVVYFGRSADTHVELFPQ